ncbi:MAG: hypothetical protein IJT91_08590 [Clostridia bacterium]|nr:hypothetical protein [Clostridia bacterium]
MVYITDNKERYFAAVNSGRGFIGYFDKIFTGLGKLYIIKGGSGTGKSSFLKKAARRHVSRGGKAEYFHCSADPDSLDGIILTDISTGIIDGTAPHTTDPVYPGAVDEIINFGSFWNSAVLEERRDEIIRIVDEKKELYKRAYAYLSAAAVLENNAFNILSGCILTDKLCRTTDRIMKNFRVRNGGQNRLRPTSAISTRGRRYFDSYESRAGIRYAVRDRYGISHAVFSALRQSAVKAGLGCDISPDPLIPERLNGLFVNAAGASFTSSGDAGYDHLINTDRFIDKTAVTANKRELKSVRKQYDETMRSAYSVLAKAQSLHSVLEEIYISSMDFSALDEFEDDFLNRIL